MAGMKNRYLAVLAASACIGLAVFSVDAQNIMPFGDSITAFGSAPQSSYRYWLYVDLTNAGVDPNSFQFVGNQNGVAGGGAPANYWPQQHYEGYGGDDGITTADGVTIAQSAASPSVNVVLLELGANDPGNNISPSQSETNLEEIIQTFAAQNPGVIIFVATPPRDANQPRAGIAKEDAITGKAVHAERKAGVDVVLVSLAGYNPRSDTSDGTHPNVKGEQYIAKQFFNAMRRAHVF